MWALYETASGRIIQSSTYPPDEIPAGAAMLWTGHCHPNTHRVVAGELVEYSADGKERLQNPPGAGWRWHPASEQWIDDRLLEQAQADKWAAVKAVRAQRFDERAVTTTGIAYRITRDKGNLADLLMTRSAAGVPSGYVSTWMDSDNVPHALDGTGLAAFATEMGARGQSIFAHSWALRAQIEAATTREQLDAIDIEADW